jgi:hypothetical protein
MCLRLVATFACVISLFAAGCAGSERPAPEPVASPATAATPPGQASALDEECVTAVGADRNPCRAR